MLLFRNLNAPVGRQEMADAGAVEVAPGDDVVAGSRASSVWTGRQLSMVTGDDGAPVLLARTRPGSILPDVTVEPLARGDESSLQRVFDGLSPESRRMRFLAAVSGLSPEWARRLADVDHVAHGCWLARIGGEPVGIGRYIRTAEEPTVAEIALEVVDACQGHGLGRLLLDVVGVAAGDAGVTSLLWLMDETNRRVRRLAAPLGSRFALDDGVLEGLTGLPVVQELDAAQIVRCVRAARSWDAQRTAA